MLVPILTSRDETPVTFRWPLKEQEFRLYHCSRPKLRCPGRGGLPQHAIPVALLFFNVGVECGQLVFVASVLSLTWLLGRAASELCEAAIVRRAFDRLDVIAATASASLRLTG